MKVADSYVENMLDLRLLIAAKIVEEIRKAVYDQTTFRCSAGISYNKVCVLVKADNFKQSLKVKTFIYISYKVVL